MTFDEILELTLPRDQDVAGSDYYYKEGLDQQYDDVAQAAMNLDCPVFVIFYMTEDHQLKVQWFGTWDGVDIPREEARTIYDNWQKERGLGFDRDGLID